MSRGVDDVVLLGEIRQHVNALPPEARARVGMAADAIKEAVRAAGGEGVLALALVGAEAAAEEWRP